MQFNLSVGMLGLTYLGIELAHAVGIFSAGPITDKLVRHLRELVSCPDPTQLTRGEGIWCHKSECLG